VFALELTFPAGRYHATPWGRHVNEADVAWPPEPWRLLRALIAVWRRKGDRVRWTDADFDALLGALAETPPCFALPEGAIHAHSRHYMPAPQKPTLVIDAFLRLPPGAVLAAVWPDLMLPPALLALAQDLASGFTYLGRAESWVAASARDDWAKPFNCAPDPDCPGEHHAVRAIAALSVGEWAERRARLLAEQEDRLRAEAAAKGRKPPTAAKLAADIGKRLGATLPESLTDALACDTGDLQKVGWSRPPASRDVLYRLAPAAMPGVLAKPRVCAATIARAAAPATARFVLAGRPRPRLTDALMVGELMRRAVMGRFGDGPPPQLNGHDADGAPLSDPRHAHAFWLAEDADDDGEIDHVIVHVPAPHGLSARLIDVLDGMTRLWMRDGRGEDAGRREWRLALEGVGDAQSFARDSRLLRPAGTLESATPFLAAGHVDSRGHARDVRRLLRLRGLPEPTGIAAFAEREGVGDLRLRPPAFRRLRASRGEARPDPAGALLRLTFAEPPPMPLALGYACHFGLGQFRAPRG
jgi:CRISPR-associated protein Csb2